MPNPSVLLEVIATTLTDARLAEQAGANRLELVTGMAEGGLTPSLGLIEAVLDAVRIPVNVIVRPHSRSFVFSADDYAVMLRDIRTLVAAGAHGIVIGMLTASGEIDQEGLKRVIEAAQGVPITFHRAFDEVRDQPRALDVLLAYPGVTNLLTSGGQPSVLQAIDTIRALVQQAQGSHCTVLAGAGLTLETVAGLVQASGVQAVHFGSGVRVGGNGLAPVDAAQVARVRALLDAL
ncbi:copper homeostasis protein CutC [Paraburkholderia bonniea]|uniref:copper homeostasis protein CutC n=1 Tax=Paraburkholderia bonniea TaxID=2152891 RepID=UPI0012911DA3|nr:copper homeostasis protein CutC [Paraburkholderia bonniea]WJF90271.1 copper homeostasis protein CutC [Paraburkholderia bonniea]WJF93586.1 copper homeostasis protein CutC [Paraburkholderia bonniea]